jgi:hypothetical protein
MIRDQSTQYRIDEMGLVALGRHRDGVTALQVGL